MKLTGFDGQAAFVAGAAGGIGRAIVDVLVEAGARVFATDLPQALEVEQLEKLSEEYAAVTWSALDVCDARAVEAAIERAEAELGPLRHGVFAAGILDAAPLLETSAEQWRRVLDVNLTGCFNLTTALARKMVPHQRGTLVAVGSNAAAVPRMNMGAYPASKAGLHMHMRCLGLELAPHGIRCNIVAPGSTLTPMQTDMWANENGAQAVIKGDLSIHKTAIPLGKLARVEDVAASAMFMMSDQAGHVTMADIFVDGGATLRA